MVTQQLFFHQANRLRLKVNVAFLAHALFGDALRALPHEMHFLVTILIVVTTYYVFKQYSRADT